MAKSYIDAEKLIAEIDEIKRYKQEQDWEKILEFAHNKGWL